MKKIAFLFAACMITFLASAQEVNFSGNWKLNASKSKLNEQFSMAPSEMIVTQKDNKLIVERHSSFQGQNYTFTDTLTMDGKECINKGWMDTKKKSTAVWSDDKKVLTVISKIPMNDGGEVTVNEIYKMDGENLVIDTNASSSYGEFKEMMVYNK